MIPDPSKIPVERVTETVLFPREAIERIFGPGNNADAPALFGPMWEYPGRIDYSYIFMTREFLNLLQILKRQGVVRGVQAEFGCSPWPATNIWFEDAGDASLPEEAIYALAEAYWLRKYASEFDAMKAAQCASAQIGGGITRLLVDYHFMVHELARELPDSPVTAEMELRAFNNREDVIYDGSHVLHTPSHIGFRAGTNPATMDRLRHLNELSFESARRRIVKRRHLDVGPERQFLSGAIVSSLLNYIPWKSFLKKVDEHLLPGGLLVVYNAQEGERAHFDWKNIVEDQDAIADFIRKDLGYVLRIHELRNAGGPVTPLYLVAQKTSPDPSVG